MRFAFNKRVSFTFRFLPSLHFYDDNCLHKMRAALLRHSEQRFGDN
jgi:hypothetical protein